MVAAGVLAGVAGVLVLGAQRLDEADRLELASALLGGSGVAKERLLVEQVVRARGRPGRERRVVVEGLMVVLEQLVRAVRQDRVGRRVVRVGATLGALPFVQPGAPTSPSALDQPPEYQAQSMPLALRRSPIVGAVCGGSRLASAVPGA